VAKRRMFSLDVVDTDKFLDMPATSQNLYFHLGMRADDEGFVSSPRKIASMVGCGIDDLKLLVTKNFLIPFENGVVVITDWKINNYIQKDRFNESKYYKEKEQLKLDANGSYVLGESSIDTECIQSVSMMDTQVRLGKDRLDNSISKDILVPKNLIPIVDRWNSLKLSQLKSIKGTRSKLISARLKEYGEESILKAIDNIRESSFLNGQNDRNWIITFDWFIKPNNFIKVLEGNYSDKKTDNRCSNEKSQSNYTVFSS